MSTFLIHSIEEVRDGPDVLELSRFVGQERDPYTGYRGWVDALDDAEHYGDPHSAHQDRLLYGGMVIKEQDLGRLGEAADWIKLDPSTLEGPEIGL